MSPHRSLYTVLHRLLEWDGNSGAAHYGDTRRAFRKPPHVGIDGMTAIEYFPHTLVHRVTVHGEVREMTTDECLGVENRLYAMDCGASDPWREDWDTAPESARRSAARKARRP